MAFPGYINYEDSNLWVACLCIVFNPLYWNALARWEYRTKWLSRFTGQYIGCSLLAVNILIFGLYRDWRFQVALQSQPGWWYLRRNFFLWPGHAFVLLGSILVITSFWKLGFFGTFLGDYFGIHLPKRVSGFPFNLFSHPMYLGSFLNFLGIALIQASQAGIFLSMIVYIMYKVAIMLEEPFTDMIYAGLENDKEEIEEEEESTGSEEAVSNDVNDKPKTA